MKFTGQIKSLYVKSTPNSVDGMRTYQLSLAGSIKEADATKLSEAMHSRWPCAVTYEELDGTFTINIKTE